MCTTGAWELNFDSAPFCNGSLHLGHVRNYVLGDVRARWLRKQGVDVKYASAYDAFGLPNEIGATEAGLSHQAFVQRHIDHLGSQLTRLRLSYSAPLMRYCDPSYYKWTQWLFLQLWDANLVHHRVQPIPFCRECNAFLATTQMVGDRCWRCGGKSTPKWSRQWYINTSSYWDRLYCGIDDLSSFSERARHLLRSLMKRHAAIPAVDDTVDTAAIASHRERDWLVSRNRTWGTPIPLVECEDCGVTSVPESDLPIKLVCHGGTERALCGVCGKSAPRVRRSLDCFFDDAWCLFGAARLRQPDENPFVAWFANPPTWVHFHAGYDTYAYLHVFRFISYFLFDRGYTPRPEPIDFFHGHDVVTSGGKKMSKRNGNAPDLDELLSTWGPDIIRLSILSNANPGKPVSWTDERLVRGVQLADTLQKLIECDPGLESRQLTQNERQRINKMRNQLWRVDHFIEQYRLRAAIDLLYLLSKNTLRLARADDHQVATKMRRRLLPYWNVLAPAAFETLPSNLTVDDIVRQSSSENF